MLSESHDTALSHKNAKMSQSSNFVAAAPVSGVCAWCAEGHLQPPKIFKIKENILFCNCDYRAGKQSL